MPFSARKNCPEAPVRWPIRCPCPAEGQMPMPAYIALALERFKPKSESTITGATFEAVAAETSSDGPAPSVDTVLKKVEVIFDRREADYDRPSDENLRMADQKV